MAATICKSIVGGAVAPFLPKDSGNYSSQALGSAGTPHTVSRSCTENYKLISFIALTSFAGVALLVVGVMGQSGALSQAMARKIQGVTMLGAGALVSGFLVVKTISSFVKKLPCFDADGNTDFKDKCINHCFTMLPLLCCKNTITDWDMTEKDHARNVGLITAQRVNFFTGLAFGVSVAMFLVGSLVHFNAFKLSPEKVALARNITMLASGSLLLLTAIGQIWAFRTLPRSNAEARLKGKGRCRQLI